MNHYTEARRFVLNAQGVERGDQTLSTWFHDQGAEHHGFTESKTQRLWRTDVVLTDLPDGVEAIMETVFDNAIRAREAAKPVPSAPPPPTPDEVLKQEMADATTNTESIAAMKKWSATR